MGKDEMPDDGLTYYHDPETYIIYREEELKFINQPTKQKGNMKVPFINQEQEFLEAVKRHQGIGFGRMMQIVSFAYHEYAPIQAFVSGDCFGMLPPEDREIYLKTKESDPLDYSIIDPRKL